jgi:hypothetical protein
MGAWGEKAFQNDSALDWFAELEAEGLTALRRLISTVAETEEDEYLDLDDGGSAIAAAEVVAAALGRGRDRVPKQVAAWVDANADEVLPEDLALARRAVERVLSTNSELCELWQEAGSDSEWDAEVAVLLTRLGGDPSVASRRGKGEGMAPPLTGAKQLERTKTVLLTFLRARGLEPSEEEMARIDGSKDGEEIAGWVARVVDAASIADMLGKKKRR